MMAKRKRYLEEFKQEAVKLVTERGLSCNQVAHDLGIYPDTLRYWLQKQASHSNTPSEGLRSCCNRVGPASGRVLTRL
jgi:transposase-like protein